MAFVITKSREATSSSLLGHLSELIKLRNKNEIPYFEVLVESSLDVLVATTWNMRDGFQMSVYHFHW